MQDRLHRAPKSMRVRRATVEHPFGTLKAWMGATHFKTRTLEKVRTEMSLHVLAYNLKRVIAILAVHRTFLGRDGAGKAIKRSAKRTWFTKAHFEAAASFDRAKFVSAFDFSGIKVAKKPAVVDAIADLTRRLSGHTS